MRVIPEDGPEAETCTIVNKHLTKGAQCWLYYFISLA